MILCAFTTNGASETRNFTVSSTFVSDCGYCAYGELARFTFCLFKQIESASRFPLIENWGNFLVNNFPSFPPIEEIQFLESTRLLVTPEKVASISWKLRSRGTSGNSSRSWEVFYSPLLLLDRTWATEIVVLVPRFRSGRWLLTLSSFQSAPWWTDEFDMSACLNYGGQQDGIPGLFAVAEADWTHFQEDMSWRTEHPVFLFLTS